MTNEELDEALRPLQELLDRHQTFSFEKTGAFTTKQNNHMEVNIMASIDFENILQKVKDAAGTVADFTTKAAKTVVEKTGDAAKSVAGKASDAAKNVAGKAQDTAKKTKLSAQIAAEREGLKKKYTELGKLYYEKYAGNTDPDFSQPVADIEAALERVAAKQAEIDALSAAEADIEIEVTEEADHVVDEVEDTVESAVETAVNEAEEIADEAAKAFDDAASTVNKPQE